MSKYQFALERVDICPKCKSDKVYNRFTNYEDTEDYHFHHDTLKCNECGFWDFPSAFNRTIMESDKSEVCPKCGAVGEVSLYNHDFFAGTIELECKCGHVDYIEKFIGKDRWDEFLEDEKVRREEAMKNYLDSLDGDDW